MHLVALSLDRADGLETRLANRPAHLDFLKANRERIKIGGPLLAPDGERMIGSMFGPPPLVWRGEIRISCCRAHSDRLHAGASLSRGAVAQG
jgi:hypothetical protein